MYCIVCKGFTGNHCEVEYNECVSSPCLNGGTCTDNIGEFSCSCGRGYTGERCHIKVNPNKIKLYVISNQNCRLISANRILVQNQNIAWIEVIITHASAQIKMTARFQHGR